MANTFSEKEDIDAQETQRSYRVDRRSRRCDGRYVVYLAKASHNFSDVPDTALYHNVVGVLLVSANGGAIYGFITGFNPRLSADAAGEWGHANDFGFVNLNS